MKTIEVYHDLIDGIRKGTITQVRLPIPAPEAGYVPTPGFVAGQYIGIEGEDGLVLSVKEARCHRIQEISDAEALAEGVEATTVGDVKENFYEPTDLPDETPLYCAIGDDDDFCMCPNVRVAFERYWNLSQGGSVYGGWEGDWEDNPWVVAVTFQAFEVHEDPKP